MAATPAEPPRLLPGRSAVYWLRWQVVSLLGGIGALPLLVFGPLLDPPIKQLSMVGGVLLLVVVVAVGLLAAGRMSRAEVRELEAGYTTLPAARYRDLWRLDPKDGKVIREPEAPG